MPCLDLSGEGFVAAEGYVGDVCLSAIIIEVELEDISNGNTADTIDKYMEFVGKLGLLSKGACLCDTVQGATAVELLRRGAVVGWCRSPAGTTTWGGGRWE